MAKNEVKAEKQQSTRAEGPQKTKASTRQSTKEKKQQIARLMVLLVVVLVGGVLFVGAASGWFEDVKVTLDAEYYCEECDGELMDLTAADYDRLVAEKKSFIVVIDQGGCTTAERLKEYASEFAKSAGLRMYRMMFSDMKETSLHEKVKYYPSVAVINKGRVWAYLRADSDEDSDVYNKYEDFVEWIERYL